MPITKMVVDDTVVLQLNLILLMLLLPHHGSEAQSPLQPAPPPSTVWDVTSVCVIVGAITATVISVTAFSVFLRRLAQSPPDGEWPHSSAPVGGVHPEILQTFPTFVYSSVADHLKDREPLQCAVCISDFDPDDTLRLLPQCNHVFHPPCIDAWLSSHDTCPVCRADLNSSRHGFPDFTIWVDKETNPRDSPRIEVLGLRNCDDLGKGGLKLKSKLKLSRSNSTGHSLVEDGACLERYTLRVPEDVKKSIMANHGVTLQRSASYNFVGSSMKRMCWSDSDGSSRGKKNGIGFAGSAAWKSPK